MAVASVENDAAARRSGGDAVATLASRAWRLSSRAPPFTPTSTRSTRQLNLRFGAARGANLSHVGAVDGFVTRCWRSNDPLDCHLVAKPRSSWNMRPGPCGAVASSGSSRWSSSTLSMMTRVEERVVVRGGERLHGRRPCSHSPCGRSRLRLPPGAQWPSRATHGTLPPRRRCRHLG